MTWNPIKLMSNLIREIRELAIDLRAATMAMSAQNVLQLEANELRSESNLLATEQNRLLAELLKRLSLTPDPGPITLLVISQEEGMLIFKIVLPAEPADASDIASGELTVTIAANEPQVIPTTKGQTEVADLRGASGDLVSASFVYIDGAGNRSAHPSTIDKVPLSDTIPPPDAGALGIAVTGQDGS
jgi:hypothetical protein